MYAICDVDRRCEIRALRGRISCCCRRVIARGSRYMVEGVLAVRRERRYRDCCICVRESWTVFNGLLMSRSCVELVETVDRLVGATNQQVRAWSLCQGKLWSSEDDRTSHLLKLPSNCCFSSQLGLRHEARKSDTIAGAVLDRAIDGGSNSARLHTRPRIAIQLQPQVDTTISCHSTISIGAEGGC